MEAFEYEYYSKGWLWYSGAIAIGLILIFIAVWQENFLFAVFVVIAGVMVIIWGKRRPKSVRFELNEKYLTIAGKERELNDFEGFYMEGNLLVLKAKGRFGSYLKIRVNEEVFDKIKKELQKKMSEVEYEESLIDVFGHWLGF